MDACFRNRRKRYYIDDLLEAVNVGADVTIERVQDGKRKYLRYSDPSFSLFEPVISQEESQLLSDTIQLLSRFKGFPQFDWLDETGIVNKLVWRKF